MANKNLKKEFKNGKPEWVDTLTNEVYKGEVIRDLIAGDKLTFKNDEEKTIEKTITKREENNGLVAIHSIERVVT